MRRFVFFLFPKSKEEEEKKSRKLYQNAMDKKTGLKYGYRRKKGS